MAGLSRRLTELNDLLMDYPVDSGVMWLSQFDGFVAGLLVCPDMIPPSVWLPVVMGQEEGTWADSSDIGQARKLLDLLMKHYNAVATDLTAGTYAPIFDYRAETDQTIWEIWMQGFTQAIALAPDSWEKFEEADDELIPSVFVTMMGLAANADPEWPGPQEFVGLSEEEEAELIRDAPDIIAESVLTLDAWTRARNVARIRGGDDMVRAFGGGASQKGRPQRALPLRFGQEVQEMLRTEGRRGAGRVHAQGRRVSAGHVCGLVRRFPIAVRRAVVLTSRCQAGMM